MHEPSLWLKVLVLTLLSTGLVLGVTVCGFLIYDLKVGKASHPSVFVLAAISILILNTSSALALWMMS